ncbi:MAG: response regulator transcription factor [Alistipes sp.]|nr:response regulator transcription factor [Alistipes sp.]
MKKVLITGSDPLLREMTASLLADMAVEIHTSQRLAEADDRCRQGLFDLVIMLDLFPFFDGSEPTSTLRPKGLRRPPLFVLSWQHSERAVLSLLECGASQYITFPTNIRRLRRKIREVIDSQTAKR